MEVAFSRQDGLRGKGEETSREWERRSRPHSLEKIPSPLSAESALAARQTHAERPTGLLREGARGVRQKPIETLEKPSRHEAI
jgi:hypothetical protein